MKLIDSLIHLLFFRKFMMCDIIAVPRKQKERRDHVQAVNIKTGESPDGVTLDQVIQICVTVIYCYMFMFFP